MTADDILYFKRRAADEIRAAGSAHHPAAASAHRAMADRYAAIIGRSAALRRSQRSG